MTQPIADSLDGLDLFRDFSYRELETLCRYFAQTTADAGEILFREGDSGDFMLVLIEGRISIYKTGENGAHLLSCEVRGRVVGEMALLDHEKRSAQCVADTTCKLLTIDHSGLERLAERHPLLAYRFMFSLARLLSKRLRRTSGILAEYLVD